VDIARKLAGALPDEPRWLEVRGILRSDRAEITGGDSVESGFVARLLHGAIAAVAVVGRPPAEAIVRSTEGVTAMTPVLAQTDNAGHVDRALAQCTGPAWAGAHAILHRLQGLETTPAQTRPSDLDVRLLQPGDPLDHLEPGLRHEMSHARNITSVAAVFVDGTPASFCYACWTTETLWDISVDTLEAYRGRALGQLAVRFMIERMRREGREPVWGALESNTSSLRLARKLGFAPVDAIAWFSRGPWAFLTGGFQT